MMGKGNNRELFIEVAQVDQTKKSSYLGLQAINRLLRYLTYEGGH